MRMILLEFIFSSFFNLDDTQFCLKLIHPSWNDMTPSSLDYDSRRCCEWSLIVHTGISHQHTHTARTRTDISATWNKWGIVFVYSSTAYSVVNTARPSAVNRSAGMTDRSFEKHRPFSTETRWKGKCSDYLQAEGKQSSDMVRDHFLFFCRGVVTWVRPSDIMRAAATRPVNEDDTFSLLHSSLSGTKNYSLQSSTKKEKELTVMRLLHRVHKKIKNPYTK